MGCVLYPCNMFPNLLWDLLSEALFCWYREAFIMLSLVVESASTKLLRSAITNELVSTNRCAYDHSCWIWFHQHLLCSNLDSISIFRCVQTFWIASGSSHSSILGCATPMRILVGITLVVACSWRLSSYLANASSLFFKVPNIYVKFPSIFPSFSFCGIQRLEQARKTIFWTMLVCCL